MGPLLRTDALLKDAKDRLSLHPFGAVKAFSCPQKVKNGHLPLKSFPEFQQLNLTLTRGGTLAGQMTFEPPIKEDTSERNKCPEICVLWLFIGLNLSFWLFQEQYHFKL